MLYLHETIDIIGTGQDAYLETVARRAEHSEKQGISRLQGCWRVVGSTGRWPQVINIWEMDGWAHWAATLARQFIPEQQDDSLAPWWATTAQWRSGGFDRILEPVPPCPTRADLIAAGLSSWVAEQTLIRARPGNAANLIDAAIGILVAPLQRRGIELFGAYRVAMRSDEIVLMWAAPTFADLCRWYEERDDDPGWRRWNAASAQMAEGVETCWLVPADECFFHPHHAQKQRAGA